VRLRTANQSLLSLPAGSLAQTGIENFATRRKILLDTRLRLKYGTSVEQLKRILEGVRALLADDPRLEKESPFIRLANFGPEAIELELNAYVLSADAGVFRRVREELLLDVAALVESVGSGFAATTSK
jgi:MscS family membrane protein